MPPLAEGISLDINCYLDQQSRGDKSYISVYILIFTVQNNVKILF
jgi:hypothetical protein